MPFSSDDDNATRTLSLPKRGGPRKPDTPGENARPGRSGPDQRVFKRRAIALGAGILILFLLVITVRGCMDERKKSSLKEYTRSIASLVQESDKQVGQQFFALLSQKDKQSAQELQTHISGYRTNADTQLKQAEKLDVPDDMESAQRSLLITLELRRNGLTAIAQRIRTALGTKPDAAEAAVDQIAAQMQTFLASDVIYQTRVEPLVQHALDQAEVGGVKLPKTHFLPSLDWLNASTIAANLGGEATGKRPKRGAEPLPGKHGSRLTAVSAGNLTLSPDTATRIPVSTSNFMLRFLNVGDHEEFDIKVTMLIENPDGKGTTKPIKVVKVVPSVAKGATAEVPLSLKTPPPTGVPLTIRVDVAAVPGEKSVENNKATYPVMFTK